MARGHRRSRMLQRLLAIGGGALILSTTMTALVAGPVVAADTATLYAGASSAPDEWSNPADAVGSTAGTYMTADDDNDDQGFRDFGISLPAGSVIDGISVGVRASSSDDSGCDLQVRLSGNGGSSWTGYDTADLTNTEATLAFGGNADRWGWDDPDWDPASVTDANFRLEVRNEDPGQACSNDAVTSVDWVSVDVRYRTIIEGTSNAGLSDSVCDKADFNFVIDMSGSIGTQGSVPSNLPDLKNGIGAFVASFEGGGGDGIYSGTRFNGSSARTLTAGYVSDATFLAQVDGLAGPTGATPTSAGIDTAAGNDAGDRAGVRNIMFVITDGSPNVPTGGAGTGGPDAWFTAADAAIGAANDARADYVVKAVYLSTAGDPGDTTLPFSSAGDAQWAAKVMTEIGGGSYLPGDFSSFVAELYEAIGCPPPAPTVEVTKTALPTSVPEPGDDVTFSVSVHNTTGKSVKLDTLTDSIYGDLDGVGSCDTGGTILAGDVYACSFTKAVSGDAGDSHTNVVTASISNADGSASDDDDATVTVTDVLPQVSLVKTATPGERPEPGGLFTYTLAITNDSDETVTITALSDDKVAPLSQSCLDLIGDTLAAGATVECSFSATHTTVGGYKNTASVTVQDDDGNSDTDTDDETVRVTDTAPLVTLDKTVDDDAKPEPGGVFTYTLKVTNTSAESVTISALTDDHALSASCLGLIGDVLTPAAFTTCTYQVTFTDAGTYPNTAVVTVEDDEGTEASDEDDATVTVTDVLPTVSLVKDVVGSSSLPEPGGDFTFKLTITNTSVETVTVTDLDDTYGLSAECLALIGDSLAPGASVSCTYVVAHADPDSYPNTATVTVADDEQNAASDSGDASVAVVDVRPTVEVVKSVDDDSKPEPGGTFTFTLTIRNLSDEAVTITVLDDDYALSQACLDLIGDTLAPAGAVGDETSCTYQVQHTTPGIYPNTATVTVTDDDDTSASDEDDETVAVVQMDPTITVVKTALPTTVAEPGGSVTYRVDVRNDSNETVWLTSLIDTKFGDLDGLGSCVADGSGTIAVGGTYTCTFMGMVVGDAGFVHQNTVVATVIDDDELQASNFDDAIVTITNVPPSVDVDKTANPTSIYPGETVAFTIVVTNESDEAVTLVSLTDSIYGDLDGQGDCVVGQVLAASASYTCSFSAVVTQTETDVVAARVVDNDQSSDENADDATVTVSPAPGLDIEKTNDAPLESIELPDGTVIDLPTAEEGSAVTFLLRYSVSAEVGLTDVLVTDVLPAGLDYVTGSATSTLELVFVGYDPATRTLTWAADALTTSGSVSYQALVAGDAAELAQPLVNVVTIDSGETDPDSDESDVFVPTEPAAATGTPRITLPPTDTTLGASATGTTGPGLLAMLGLLGAVLLVVMFVTPSPSARRRIARRTRR